MNWRMTIAVCLSVLTVACAAPAKVENMIVTSVANQDPSDLSLRKAICVKSVTGGEKTDPMWVSEVDDQSFQAALEESLRKQALLAESPDTCSYDLNANLLGLSKPTFGYDLEVTAHVNYELIHHASNEPYFLKTVTTAFTATLADAYVAVKRMRIANEGAVRRNIQTYIDAVMKYNP